MCAKDYWPGTIYAHICACPKCFDTNPAVLRGAFGSIPDTPERQKFREVLAAAQEVLKPEGE